MTASPRPHAVLFDLWGTVAPDWTGFRDAVSQDMAADLGVDGEAFAAAVRESYGDRFLGRLGDLEATVATLARRCGGDPPRAAVQCAADRRLDLTQSLLEADVETLAVLDEFRARGYLTGLVTDSSIETPTLWPRSSLAPRFDAVAFSCLVGVRKPHASLYLHTLVALGLQPSDCVFVGDGGSHELSGARALGMTAIRLRTRDAARAARYDDDVAFDGPEVSCLSDLLDMTWAAGSGPA